MLKAKLKVDNLIKFGEFQINEYKLTLFELKIRVNKGNYVFGIDLLRVEFVSHFLTKGVVRSLFGFFITNAMRMGVYEVPAQCSVDVLFFEKEMTW